MLNTIPWIHRRVKGVRELYGDKLPLKKGNVIITERVVSKEEASFENLRHTMHGNSYLKVTPGKYTLLMIDRNIVMSDTDMERESNLKIIEKANGKVLIGGLGIGMVLHNIVSKPEVTSVDVVEINKNLLELVSPFFKHEKVNIIEGDIFNFNCNGTKYDTIYFDVWNDICTDNLDEIKKLHNKFKHKLNRQNPNCFMNSWMKEQLQFNKRRGW